MSNERRERIINALLELPSRRLWEGRIRGVGTIEAWYVQVDGRAPGEVLIVQTFDNERGVEIYSDRGTPAEMARLIDWITAGPPR